MSYYNFVSSGIDLPSNNSKSEECAHAAEYQSDNSSRCESSRQWLRGQILSGQIQVTDGITGSVANSRGIHGLAVVKMVLRNCEVRLLDSKWCFDHGCYQAGVDMPLNVTVEQPNSCEMSAKFTLFTA